MMPTPSRTGAPPAFTQDEIQRYSRHLIMPEVGMDGQKRLKDASVLVVGTGGLGSPLAMYLAAAGVGQLGLVDFDVVEFSNLQRQIIHSTESVGRKKLESARDRLHGINPEVDITLHEVALVAENALDILRPYDVVVDGTDNYPTRYLVNDACVLLGKPNVYGSIFRFEGQVSVFDALKGPCYRCLYPEPPPPGLVPSCAEGGVLGVLPGVIGTLQALETMKLILERGEPLIGRLLLFDALAMSFREVRLKKSPDCPICGPKRTIHALIDYDAFCGVPGREAASHAAAEQSAWEITPRDLKAKLDQQAVTLIDVREPTEWEIAHIPAARLIPLAELPNRLAEIPQDGDIVLHCHHGVRSMRALELLRDHAGFTRVRSLRGGIDAWSLEIDPAIPRY
jgi:sulfur-carrier protein adenylyltransferase/sulfurtransferase